MYIYSFLLIYINGGNIMYIIYKLTNKINGKIYIGQTCRSLEERFNEE